MPLPMPAAWFDSISDLSRTAWVPEGYTSPGIRSFLSHSIQVKVTSRFGCLVTAIFDSSLNRSIRGSLGFFTFRSLLFSVSCCNLCISSSSDFNRSCAAAACCGFSTCSSSDFNWLRVAVVSCSFRVSLGRLGCYPECLGPVRFGSFPIPSLLCWCLDVLLPFVEIESSTWVCCSPESTLS